MTFSPSNLTSFRSTAFIALGSNLRDPDWQVRQGMLEIDEIPDVSLVKMSSLYLTAPVGIVEQPPFVNAVVQVETTLSPHDLLRQLTEIEQRHGRVRSEKNGPRTLDLDILLFNEWCIADDQLVVPHPRMHERAFALVPLLEVAENVFIPDRGFAKEILASLDTGDIRKLNDGQTFVHESEK
jgi:2-amino-4-hydroxy-6-hydroxymethyldihydropteridine diphosphokinase